MRKAPKAGSAASSAGVRCAIYTRKSSEEGLEQEFNSLDAQREACEAYILSQRHEGWIVLPQMYDDGGISGGTMERPALKHLLADVEAGRIDTVVVYKVDRLTRTLGDFAKIVEVFDRAGSSFVSVTQAFNTTTSMGRLTLNMLLSFAQFKREVTGERIRDKIAASKQKGMWMGGLPPLGYDVKDRKLVINKAEAETVRHIFRRYVEFKSVSILQHDLNESGIVSKQRIDRFGRESGGKPLGRGALYAMLQNRLYRGEIVHKDKSYPGEHSAIVEEEFWNHVQSELAENRIERRTGVRASAPSLLTGLLHDDSGQRMTPTHANKKGRRYRYYVSQSLITRIRNSDAPLGWRVPAADIEKLVEDRVLDFLRDRTAIFDAVHAEDLNVRMAIVHHAADLAGRWSALDTPERAKTLQHLVARIVLRRKVIEIGIRPSGLPNIADPEFDHGARNPEAGKNNSLITLSVPAALKRAGMETRLLVESAADRREPDRSMLRLLAQSRRFNEMIMRGDATTVAELAKQTGVSPSYFTRILRLSFLAPEIVKAILNGRHSQELTARRLSLHTRIVNDWPGQKALLGVV